MHIIVKNFLELGRDVLYSNIKRNFEKGKKLVLDFRGIDEIDEEFLGETLGRVIEEHNFQAISTQINFINVNNDIKKSIKKLI
ncbi:STAS-like domain-containing protein [Haliovirga abyssi]|uniref:DUF4325 domain-containing protein n=1 Tax=Haliovirga abyssi TaxID=2996794 RepID=A0AAU9DBZ2_9FUSO|nr:STAS-like domain-containing protein [Haliovirga abyssi]BDU49802.1 hypothetical protein HLVA_03710 [Haliovirga abyssi]